MSAPTDTISLRLQCRRAKGVRSTFPMTLYSNNNTDRITDRGGRDGDWVAIRPEGTFQLSD